MKLKTDDFYVILDCFCDNCELIHNNTMYSYKEEAEKESYKIAKENPNSSPAVFDFNLALYNISKGF
jgi:hypothetical protein